MSNTAKDIEARKKAFIGARMVIAEGISSADAVKRTGAKISSLSKALVLLAHGTPEEIAEVEESRRSMHATIEAIRGRVSLKERRSNGRPRKYAHDVRQKRDEEVAIANAVGVALTALTGLPKPTDVVIILRKHRVRTQSTDKRLLAALAWLTEFSDAWTK